MFAEYATMIGEHVVFVSKIGGGTVGRRYDGAWDIEIFDAAPVTNDDGETVLVRVLKETMNSYSEHTHRSAARMAHGFLDTEGV